MILDKKSRASAYDSDGVYVVFKTALIFMETQCVKKKTQADYNFQDIS